MERVHPLLLYFTITTGATVCGIFYWMVIENLGKVKFKFAFACILTLFITPFGAWVVSLVLKALQLRKELKQLNESAA